MGAMSWFENLFMSAETKKLRQENEIMAEFNRLLTVDKWQAYQYLLDNTDDSFGSDLFQMYRKISREQLAEREASSVSG